MDASFLASLGITGSIPSAEVRLFGKRGGMLSEANNAPYRDDLEELALWVVDGGDGILSGSDQVLFYSPGPHPWITDSAGRKFRHQKNLYSEKVYYYLTIGGAGKRIAQQVAAPAVSTYLTSFDERYFHELDSVNFLSSGKEWWGEEFSSRPGHTLSRQLAVPGGGAVAGTPLTVRSSMAARSANSGSSFAVSVNSEVAHQFTIPGVGTANLDLFAREGQGEGVVVVSEPGITLTVTYTPGSFNAQGWLNWLEVFYRRALALPQTGQLTFRDWNSVGAGPVGFQLAGADVKTQVWDVSDPMVPVAMAATLSGSELSFSNEATNLREYVAFDAGLIPEAVGRVANQDLHNTAETDYIIITHPNFLAQAQRLAAFHRERSGLRTTVVTTDQVFHEFSAGVGDPTALRDFVRMFYDRYRSTWLDSGKYLLLFGKASFDYKNRVANNTNLVPAYESPSSLDPLATYTSDDFFGFLDEGENINSGLVINELDIGIGRIPVKSIEEATNFVDKVEAYHAAPSLGPWRNNLDFVADDEDQNLHLQDAEVLTATTATVAPAFNRYKLYLDLFKQESGAAGERYPGANEAINNNIYNGTLLWNYSGHGGATRLAEEVVLDHRILNEWNNANRLPLFITATCDFAPYDNPSLNSLGERLLVAPKVGAIALMTTTRVVFAYSNRILNNNYLRLALERDTSGRYKTLGQAVQAAKNFTYQTSGDIINNRKFALLGDPAMTLGFPQLGVQPTRVNGKSLTAGADTLSATEFVTIEGEVTGRDGRRLDDFSGTVYLTMFDKPVVVTTLGNDPTSLAVPVQTQTASLFKGKVSASNGQFAFKFRLPKDINYQFGRGKVSLYAQDGVRDANGYSTEVIIGGLATGGLTDAEGPQVKAYLNDERFVNGSITNEAPVLIVKLSDSSGINTGGGGIDHDLTATLDEDNRSYYTLNEFYEADLDSYQQGTVRFQLPRLAPGRHTLKIKAWDVLNNSTEYLLEFTVVSNEELRLDHVLNYPNPFTTHTAFWFEHNKPGVDLQAHVEILTITGKIIKTLSQTINTTGNRSMDIQWDGRDEYGDRVGRGVYLYRLSVRSADGKKASRLGRLVLIR